MVAGKAMRKAMGLQKSSGGGSSTKEETPPKPPLPSSSSESKSASHKTPFSRSFGAYFPRSSAQVQPRPPNVAELLRLVEELRDRESRLKTELLEHKLLKESVAIVPVLENEIVSKNIELERGSTEIENLKYKNERLRTELEKIKTEKEESEEKLKETEAKILELTKENGRKMREMEEEIFKLRKEHERKVVELEVEISELKKKPSRSSERGGNAAENDELSSSQRFQGLVEVSVKSNLIKSLKRTNSKSFDFCSNLENQRAENLDFKREEAEIERPRHSRCNSDELAESTLSNLRSRAPRVPKPPPRPSSSGPSASKSTSSSDSCDSEDSLAFVEKTVPPPPPPPPPVLTKTLLPPPPPPPPVLAKPMPPPPHLVKATVPPPPPPPPNGTRPAAAKVRRVPEVVEFYHSLMRRDSRRESGGGSVPEVLPATGNARDMIGEIENRSAYLLAIKTDVETQGDFIRFLIKEVENAAFANIEDVVPFVKWLDDELSYLVDERAVLKHFEWPEQKADALREAAFGYCDLRKIESEASSFRDGARQPCGAALKKMQALLEKLEHGVYNLSRMRESAAKRYKGFNIPMDWMLETGIVSQIKLASVKLAMKYMKRVSAELESVGGGPEEEELIIQGVRFAFRVHQFAGGFDVETMRAFQELRDKARSCHAECQGQQQKLFCRSTAC